MRFLFALLFALAATPAAAQTSPLCGRDASDPEALMLDLLASGATPSGADKMYLSVMEEAKRVMWTFTMPAHQAHPAVVCRQMVEKNGAILVEMQVRCSGPKPSCDQMVEDFNALNERMRQHIQHQLKKQ